MSTLAKDLSHRRSDNVAQVYLGLTRYRLRSYQRAALTNVQEVCKGNHNWLDYLNENFRFSFGKGAKPEGTVRAGIQSDLAMISSGKIDSAQLIADAESLGIE